jgi:hypothetical protein
MRVTSSSRGIIVSSRGKSGRAVAPTSWVTSPIVGWALLVVSEPRATREAMDVVHRNISSIVFYKTLQDYLATNGQM